MLVKVSQIRIDNLQMLQTTNPRYHYKVGSFGVNFSKISSEGDVSEFFPRFCRCHILMTCGCIEQQESPPAWTQEAYRPPSSKYSLCWLVSWRGGATSIQSQWGYPPSSLDKGVPPSSLNGGTPCQPDGSTPIRQKGVPPQPDWGSLCPRQLEGVSP